MTNQKTPVQGGATEVEELAAKAFPHRNVYLEGAAYMAEERSRVPLREAFALGYRAALSVSASADPADEHHDAEERKAESEDHAATVTGDDAWVDRQLANEVAAKMGVSTVELQRMAVRKIVSEWGSALYTMEETVDRLFTALAAPVEVDAETLRKARAETWDEAVAAVHAWWSLPPERRPAVVVNPYGAGLRGEG